MLTLPNWTTPAERQTGWELAYVETVERHMAAPFEWGVSDCLIVPADLSLAMCGRDPLPGKLRAYRTERAAMKVLLGLGFTDVEQGLAAAFPPIPKLLARRGDCGVLEQVVDGKPWLVTFIVTDRGLAVGKGPHGHIHVPVSRLKSTYAIGAF